MDDSSFVLGHIANKSSILVNDNTLSKEGQPDQVTAR
jgi:hypothetical protein